MTAHTRALKGMAYALAILLVAVNGLQTFSITKASATASTVANSHRGGSHLLIDPNFVRLRNFLDATSDRDVLVLWYDNELFSGAYRTAWINYFARHNRVWSMTSTASGGFDELAASVGERLSKLNQQALSKAIVVTWKPLSSLDNRLLFANPLLSVYETRSQDEIQRLIEESRVMVFRKLSLEASSDLDVAKWYPVWVAGPPGNATLLTMRFGAFNEFRYDQWGYPALLLKPRGECRGRVMSLTVQLMLIDKHLRIVCNGAVAEAQLPSTFSNLQNSGSVRFGWSNGITSLGANDLLEEKFAGAVAEIP